MTVCSCCGRVRRRYRRAGSVWWLADYLDACPWCDLAPATPQAPLHDLTERCERDDPPAPT